MRRRALIVTLAAGAAIGVPALHAAKPRMSVEKAIEIARLVMNGRGLAPAHPVAALYAGGDRRAEGAAFAIIVDLHPESVPQARSRKAGSQLKMLIQEDGQTSLQEL